MKANPWEQAADCLFRQADAPAGHGVRRSNLSVSSGRLGLTLAWRGVDRTELGLAALAQQRALRKRAGPRPAPTRNFRLLVFWPLPRQGPAQAVAEPLQLGQQAAQAVAGGAVQPAREQVGLRLPAALGGAGGPFGRRLR